MKRSSIALVLITLATTALAQAPRPDPRLKELQPVAGNWQCTGEVFPSPFGPAHPEVGNVDGHWMLGNFWLSLHFKETKTAKSPVPYEISMFLGYDSELKKLVLGSVDNTGAYETAQSDGWKGDVLTFEGPSHGAGMTIVSRDTFTTKGPNVLSHSFLYQEKDGSWKKVEEDHCTRTK